MRCADLFGLLLFQPDSVFFFFRSVQILVIVDQELKPFGNLRPAQLSCVVASLTVAGERIPGRIELHKAMRFICKNP